MGQIPYEWELLDVQRELSKYRLWPVRFYGVFLLLAAISRLANVTGTTNEVLGQSIGVFLGAVALYFGVLYLLSRPVEVEEEVIHHEWGGDETVATDKDNT